MVITGSAIFIEPGTSDQVVLKLAQYPEITFQGKSESGSELVVNFEAENHEALEMLCDLLKEELPEIIEITHIYVNFQEEVEKLLANETAPC